MLVDLTIKGFLAETAGYCDGTYRDGGKPDDR